MTNTNRQQQMPEQKKGIGDKYQRETKYSRTNIGQGYLDWENRPSPYKQYPDAKKIIELPAPLQNDGLGLWETLCRRRSERNFITSALTIKEVSQLLFATQGISAAGEGITFRTAPSAGALYPIETYLLVNRVETLPSGLYHYNVLRNYLELLRTEDLKGRLTRAALGQSMVQNSALVFIWTAVVARSKWKYGERAYRYIYLDAGHIGQNLYLASVALHLGCCTIGALFDDEVNEILGVDGVAETTVYMGVVGHLGDP